MAVYRYDECGYLPASAYETCLHTRVTGQLDYVVQTTRFPDTTRCCSRGGWVRRHGQWAQVMVRDHLYQHSLTALLRMHSFNDNSIC